MPLLHPAVQNRVPPEKSSASRAWRSRWRVRTRPAALWLRLRHWLSVGERTRARLRELLARWRYRRAARPCEATLLRPVGTTAGPATLTLFLDPRDGLQLAAVRRALAAAWPPHDATLLVLVRYRRPPLLASRADAEVRSWGAAPALLAHLPPPAASLLTRLDAALQVPAVRVRVVQVGGEDAPRPAGLPAAGQPLSTAWVVPHRGSVAWLTECLARITPQLRPGLDEARVCLDEVPTPALLALQAAFPTSWFGALRRPGVGPFVARQRAAELTKCKWLLFQDSDDVPTLDRAAALQAALVERRLDAVGSHELRLDYLTGRVVAVRFPLDASAALRVATGHPALFPTLLVRRASLLAVGGFSTHLRFALDTQLLLRAAPTWRLGNVDAFLYLRRRHPNSLTTDPATALGSPAREIHRAQWHRDYVAVQAGQLRAATSSLAVQRGTEYEGNELLPL